MPDSTRAEALVSLNPLKHAVSCFRGLASALLMVLLTHCSTESPKGTGGTAGTSSGGSGNNTGGAGASGAGGSSPSDDSVGRFSVTIEPARTTVLGIVRDGPAQPLLVWRVTDEANGCQLLKRKVPFCDPPCSGGSSCVDDGKCLTPPNPQNVGTVQVQGIGGADFQMEFSAGNYQPPSSISIPSPPFEEGAAFSLRTSGGAYAPLTLQGKGIAPIEMLGTGKIPMERDKPLKLQWTPGKLAEAKIKISIDISHHGGQKGEIDCRVPDSGSLEIPAKLITGLIQLGVAGYPALELARAFESAAALPHGQVELLAISSVVREIQIPGLESCDTDADCSAGKKCQADRTCS